MSKHWKSILDIIKFLEKDTFTIVLISKFPDEFYFALSSHAGSHGVELYLSFGSCQVEKKLHMSSSTRSQCEK